MGTTSAVPFAEIEPVDADDLWEGYIAGVTVIAGKEKLGKSLIAADIAARVSRGDVMPDGTPSGPPGSVVFISLEDDLHASVVRRLSAAGGDCAAIWNLSEVEDDDGRIGEFSLPEHEDELYAVIDEIGDVRMIVIDPLSDVASCSLTNARTVRQKLMRPLRVMHRYTGASIVLIHHVTKDGDIAGSPVITAAPRTTLIVRPDETNPAVRVLSVHSTNGLDMPDLRYCITGPKLEPRVEWRTLSPHDANAPAEAKVMALLKAHPDGLTSQQVASRSGLNHDSVRVVFKRFRDRGAAWSPERGVTALVKSR